MSDPLLILRTPRLTLRPLVASDRAAWTEMMLASEESFVRSGMVIEPDTTLDQRFDQTLHKTTSAIEAQTGYRFQAFVAEGQPDPGRMIGGAALNNIARGVFMNADMGWGIRSDYEGKGYAFEICSALLDFAFAPSLIPLAPSGLALHRVQANVRPENDRSLRLAARLGFRREGLALKMLHIEGDWRDHIMHAKLAEEHNSPHSAMLASSPRGGPI